jgi:hypothetical protein
MLANRLQTTTPADPTRPTGVAGTDWTSEPSLASAVGGSVFMSGIAWNGTVFCAVGTSVCATSPDGITWTNRPALATAITSPYSPGGVAANPATGRIVVVCGSGKAAASTDNGVSWTSGTSSFTTAFLSTSTPTAIAWNGTVFCAVGYTSASPNRGRCATSTTGTSWTNRSTEYLSGWTAESVSSYPYSLSVTSSYLVSLGTRSRCAVSNLSTSPNCDVWTSRTSGLQGYWSGQGFTSTSLAIQGAAWNGTVLCVVGGNRCLTSGNDTFGGANSWANRSTAFSAAFPSGDARAIAWNGTVFCVVGASGNCATSPDGVTWTTRAGLAAAVGGNTLYSIATNTLQNKFVTVGYPSICASTT